jgi:ligand-binding SRPBCC domain-containing protein
MELFEIEVELACSQQEVFDYLIRPDNIKLISPPDVGLFFFNAPDVLEMGSQMDFRVRAYGLIREASHKVTVFESPGRFTDEQISGPLQAWTHEHVIETLGPNRSRVIDRIEFLPPKGVAGLVMNKNRIRENLEDGFDYRHGKLEEILGKGV